MISAPGRAGTLLTTRGRLANIPLHAPASLSSAFYQAHVTADVLTPRDEASPDFEKSRDMNRVGLPMTKLQHRAVANSKCRVV